MDKVHPLSTLIIARSLDIKKDPCPRENDEKYLGLEVSYLSAIRALINLLIIYDLILLFCKCTSKI
jgi:hypothetical protein